MKKSCAKPCNQCPFRRKAAPGYLGELSFKPLEFLIPLLQDVTMPCHQTIDYDDPCWEAQLPGATPCAGALAFAANISKLPRDPKAPRDKPDRKNVFASVPEFIAYHSIHGADE